MKKLFVLLGLFAFVGCAGADMQASVLTLDPEISIARAQEFWDDAEILDVRTPEEYAEGCLDGSENIDYYGDDFKARMAKLDKEKSYIVYCRSGRRSGEAVTIMRDLGFDNVSSMQGGISAWIEQGHNIVKSC